MYLSRIPNVDLNTKMKVVMFLTFACFALANVTAYPHGELGTPLSK